MYSFHSSANTSDDNLEPQRNTNGINYFSILTRNHFQNSLSNSLSALCKHSDLFPEQLVGKLLYAKLSPHIKKSKNIAFFESGTFDQLVANLERELELNGMETDVEMLFATMRTTTTTHQKQTKNTNRSQLKHRSCRKPCYVVKEGWKCLLLEQEQQDEKQTAEISPTRIYSPFPHCQRSNHTAELFCNGPNAANRHKRFKIENGNDCMDESHKFWSSTKTPQQKSPRTLQKNSQQFHWSDLKIATHYVQLHSRNTFYHTYQTPSIWVSSVVKHQQMETAHTKRYYKMHLVKKETRNQQIASENKTFTFLRSWPEDDDYDPNLSIHNVDQIILGKTFLIKKFLISRTYIIDHKNKLRKTS